MNPTPEALEAMEKSIRNRGEALAASGDDLLETIAVHYLGIADEVKELRAQAAAQSIDARAGEEIKCNRINAAE